MTEALFHKLEEKISLLLSEMNGLRKELNQVRQENTALKFERSQYAQKMEALIGLFDAVEEAVSDDRMMLHSHNFEKEQIGLA